MIMITMTVLSTLIMILLLSLILTKRFREEGPTRGDGLVVNEDEDRD